MHPGSHASGGLRGDFACQPYLSCYFDRCWCSIPAGYLAYDANSIEFHIVVSAALESNCPFTPLNPKTATISRDTERYLSLVVPPDKVVAESLAKSATHHIARAELLLVCGDQHIPDGWQALNSIADCGIGRDASFDVLNIQRNMEYFVLLLSTSSTTSLPKGVPHTNTSWASITINVGDVIKIDSSRVSYDHGPIFHVFGVNFWTVFYSTVHIAKQTNLSRQGSSISCSV
jgi:acyl-CoA synthetase (AMP-forming)/AMP-acid ligase II